MASRARFWVAAVLIGLTAVLASPAAAAGSSRPFAMAVVDQAGSGAISVTETVSQPGNGQFTVWPGAYGTSVPAGLAALVRNRFTIPAGVGSAQVKFYVRMTTDGLTVRWYFPTKVGVLWILVGKGLTLPVVLNQKFSPNPPTVWNGSDYSVYSAKNVAGNLVLNLQHRQPTGSPWQGVLPWLWLVPVVLVAYVVLRRLRWRSHA